MPCFFLGFKYVFYYHFPELSDKPLRLVIPRLIFLGSFLFTRYTFYNVIPRQPFVFYSGLHCVLFPVRLHKPLFAFAFYPVTVIYSYPRDRIYFLTLQVMRTQYSLLPHPLSVYFITPKLINQDISVTL